MRRLIAHVAGLGVAQAYGVGWVVHELYYHDGGTPVADVHSGHRNAGHTIDPLTHYLRDATVAVPFVLAGLLLGTLLVRHLLARYGIPAESGRAKLIFAGVAALAGFPGVLARGLLAGELGTGVALAALRYSFALILVAALVFGVPWRTTRRSEIHAQPA